MYEKIKAYIRETGMLKKSDKVIAGVSGGADSICLLCVLLKLQEEYGLEISAVHVNHGLRGADSDADEEYVRTFCRGRGVPLNVYAADVRGIMKERRLSGEEAGRVARREAFLEASRKLGGAKIALAHHQNDNVETLLLNLARGSGLKGLGGMRPVSGAYIRPLLCIERREIENYLENCGISYCTDHTNAEDMYTRNRIRNHILPYMEEEINSGFIQHAAASMEQLQNIWDYISSQTSDAASRCIRRENGLLIQKEELENEPEVLRPYVLHQAICMAAGAEKDIGAVHIEALGNLLKNQSGRKIDLPYSIEAVRCYEGVRIQKKGAAAEADKALVSVMQRGIPGVYFRIFDRNEAPGTFPENPYTKWFDYDIIKNTVELRNRRAGDYITIDRQGSTQKLKKYFINAKIPAEKREEVLLVADGSHIMWIVGYRQDQSYQVTGNTKRILEIEINGGLEHV